MKDNQNKPANEDKPGNKTNEKPGESANKNKISANNPPVTKNKQSTAATASEEVGEQDEKKKKTDDDTVKERTSPGSRLTQNENKPRK